MSNFYFRDLPLFAQELYTRYWDRVSSAEDNIRLANNRPYSCVQIDDRFFWLILCDEIYGFSVEEREKLREVLFPYCFSANNE